MQQSAALEILRELTCWIRLMLFSSGELTFMMHNSVFLCRFMHGLSSFDCSPTIEA